MLIAFLTFPSPWKHLVYKVLLWNSIFIKGDLPMDQTLVTFWSSYSCIFLWQAVSCTWRFLLHKSPKIAGILEPLMVLWTLECSCILKTSFDCRTIKIVGTCMLDSRITDTWIANSGITDSWMKAFIGASRIGFWKIVIIFFVSSLDWTSKAACTCISSSTLTQKSTS